MGAALSKPDLRLGVCISLGVGAYVVLRRSRTNSISAPAVDEDAAAAEKVTKRKSGITPRSENFMNWYNDVIDVADLVDNAPVRGCKILKPNGFALWESIQSILDPKLKAVGVQNVYFPLLIPMAFMAREADHIEGFAKECAVVTHHRLRSTMVESWWSMLKSRLHSFLYGSASTHSSKTSSIEVDPTSALSEPYIIRPTSETLVWDSFSRWIRSYRDLPYKVNQWVNVMRWEHQTRTFLRGAEFLWQEGHTAHADREEAQAKAKQILDLYAELAEEHLCLPLIKGQKSDRERFAGADDTYTIEVLSQNGMSIQAGTSHFLGQKFAEAFNVEYMDRSNTKNQVWGTSWGVSTRLIGAVITALSDDDGLVLPPAIASVQVVILAVHSKDSTKRDQIILAIDGLCQTLVRAGLRARSDCRFEVGLVQRRYEWEQKGVPLRLEIGARDLEASTAMAKVRTGGEKFSVQLCMDFAARVQEILEDVRKDLKRRSMELKQRLTFCITSKEQFMQRLQEAEPGFLLVPWGGNSEDEEQLQHETGATLRCYPFEQDCLKDGQCCPLTGKLARRWTVFAKAF